MGRAAAGRADFGKNGTFRDFVAGPGLASSFLEVEMTAFDRAKIFQKPN
jgi:hypothetical protein